MKQKVISGGTVCVFIITLILYYANLLCSQVVINEGSNKNYLTLADEDGEYPDWIELFNSGSSPVDLEGFGLTDSPSEPFKWIFPHCNLLAGDYLIVFCSSKDRFASPAFTTVINTGSFTPSVGWNTHIFTTPFYWDGISNLLINVCSYSSAGYITNSVFNQSETPFNSTIYVFEDGSPAACKNIYGTPCNWRPNMKLNNCVIGTGNLQNSTTSYPAPYGNWYWCARHQMLVRAQELTEAGLTAGLIGSLSFNVVYTDPVNYDYIEISLNAVAQNEISSLFLPDDGYSFHTNFSISGEGETVALFSPAQSLVSSLEINSQRPDISCGSYPDASGNVVLFLPPTPKATNDLSEPFSTFAEPISFSVNSGFFTSPFTVTIINPNGYTSQVYYTLDGGDPTEESIPYYDIPIPVIGSTVLKARAFKPGMLPGDIKAATYFFNVDHTTPVISVITPNENLYGAGGIFDNFNKDWLRSAYVEYFDSMPSHPLVFSQPAGMMVDGGAGGSRSNPQHSFRLEFDNGVLGTGPVNHVVIPDRPYRSVYSDFYLRNGSNQYLAFPYKDAAQVKMMSNGINNYYSSWRPVTVYINGEYFGLYELREKFNQEMFMTLENPAPASIEILTLSYFYGCVLRSLCGSVDNFWNSWTAMQQLDPDDPTYWNQADQHIDLTYYTDYIIGESWMGSTDWPWNNIKIYRSNATGFRWRFCLIDLELAMAPNSWTDCYFDHVGYMLGQDPNNPYIGTWLKSIQNERYRNYFINRYADVMNTAFDTSVLLAIDNNFYNLTLPEMDNEYFRWGDPGNIQGQLENFYNNHMIFQSQLICRSPVVRNQIQNHFGLAGQVQVMLDVQPPGSGSVKISTVSPQDYPWQGIYFNGLPVKIEAVPEFGYQFDSWLANGLIEDTLNPVFNDTLQAVSVLFEAHFSPVVVRAGQGVDENLEFTLYPSPATHSVNLVSNGQSGFSEGFFRVTDINGKWIKSGSLVQGKTTTPIDLHELNPGLYYVVVTSALYSPVILKFIKK
jgi:hypothetical protein